MSGKTRASRARRDEQKHREQLQCSVMHRIVPAYRKTIEHLPPSRTFAPGIHHRGHRCPRTSPQPLLNFKPEPSLNPNNPTVSLNNNRVSPNPNSNQ